MNYFAADDTWGHVEFSLTPSLIPRDDPANYVVEIQGMIRAKSYPPAVDDREGIETDVGHMELLLVLSTQACNDGIHLAEVCDSHSSELSHAYATLFKANESPREELEIEPSYNDLLYIDSLDLDEPFHELAVRALETAISTFAAGGLIVAVSKELELSVRQWRQLGFKKIVGSEVVFRDNCRVNPYVERVE